MKKYLLCLVVLFTMASIIKAQELNSLITDFSKVENANYQSIGQDMLSMRQQQSGQSKHTEFLKKMEGMEVLSLGECSEDVKDSFRKKVLEIKDEKGYTTLIKVKEGDNNVRIMTKKENDVITELYIFAIGNNDVAAVKIKGKFEESDIQDIANKQMK